MTLGEKKKKEVFLNMVLHVPQPAVAFAARAVREELFWARVASCASACCRARCICAQEFSARAVLLVLQPVPACGAAAVREGVLLRAVLFVLQLFTRAVLLLCARSFFSARCCL
jgi:hypothetical protein